MTGQNKIRAWFYDKVFAWVVGGFLCFVLIVGVWAWIKESVATGAMTSHQLMAFLIMVSLFAICIFLVQRSSSAREKWNRLADFIGSAISWGLGLGFLACLALGAYMEWQTWTSGTRAIVGIGIAAISAVILFVSLGIARFGIPVAVIAFITLTYGWPGFWAAVAVGGTWYSLEIVIRLLQSIDSKLGTLSDRSQHSP